MRTVFRHVLRRMLLVDAFLGGMLVENLVVIEKGFPRFQTVDLPAASLGVIRIFGTELGIQLLNLFTIQINAS